MTIDELPGGPLDIATLSLMGRRAMSHPLAIRWRFRPDSISPRFLEIELAAEQYPTTVSAARLELRWFEDAAYTIHYLEVRNGALWQCRWDRHPKPDAPRAHFHPPPDAGPEIEPSMLSASHPLELLFSVLDWIEERVAELFED